MPSPPDRPRLCILGSINMDLVVRAPRLPAPGETLLGGPFETHPGGKGANQAVAAARMGADVAFIGRTGDDEHGRRMLDTLRAERIVTTRVTTTPGAATGVALIAVGSAGENTIIVAPGANALLTPADADAARETLAAADVLLVQLEVPLDAVTRAAEIARDSGTTVMLNAAPGARLPAALLAAIDVLIVNETEAAIVADGLLGVAATDPLDRLAAGGLASVIMTLGARGAVALHARVRGQAAPFSVEPLDTVGAGDAFCGTLAARWAEHQIGGGRAGGVDAMGLLDALCWANAAGALATTRRGAIPSLPTRAEVLDLLRRESRPGEGRP